MSHTLVPYINIVNGTVGGGVTFDNGNTYPGSSLPANLLNFQWRYGPNANHAIEGWNAVVWGGMSISITEIPNPTEGVTDFRITGSTNGGRQRFSDAPANAWSLRRELWFIESSEYDRNGITKAYGTPGGAFPSDWANYSYGNTYHDKRITIPDGGGQSTVLFRYAVDYPGRPYNLTVEIGFRITNTTPILYTPRQIIKTNGSVMSLNQDFKTNKRVKLIDTAGGSHDIINKNSDAEPMSEQKEFVTKSDGSQVRSKRYD